MSETRNLSFVVQSSFATADKMTSEIQKFVSNVRSSLLEPLTDDDVAVFVKGSLLKRTEQDKKLATEVTRNWNEIATGRLQFDRLQKEAAALMEINKKDILNYWDRFVLGTAGERRMLISEVVPQSKKPQPKKTYTESNLFGIDDIDGYRKQSGEKLKV